MKHYSVIIAFFAGFLMLSCSSKSNFSSRVVGYLPLWESARWDSIEYASLTHCIFSFATYTSDGKVNWDISDAPVHNVVAKCHYNGVKALVALGGFGGFNTDGNPFATSEKRSNIIRQLSEIVGRYNLDGVDIDIEIKSTDPIWAGYDSFVEELRNELGDDKLLTMAVGTWFTDAVLPQTYGRLDFINIMAYDNAFGDADVAPISMLQDMLSYYSDRGVEGANMVIGVPFYGYSEGGVSHHWYEILSLDSANINRDYDPTNGIYFNGVPTIKQKIEMSRDFGGIMIWQIAEDDLGDRSMLRLISRSLRDM